MIPNLLNGVQVLGGLHGELEEAQYSSHDVDHGVGGARRGLNVPHVAPGVLKHEGLGQLSRDARGQLEGPDEGALTGDAVELLEGHIGNL